MTDIKATYSEHQVEQITWDDFKYEPLTNYEARQDQDGPALNIPINWPIFAKGFSIPHLKHLIFFIRLVLNANSSSYH